VGTTAPELDVARVQRWCSTRVPDHARHQVRIEREVSGRDRTVVERHPPWAPGAGPEWIRTPVARDVADLLDGLEEDPTALCWG
jgi:hypothetical protein